jgi:hypothetical protein
MCEACGDVPTSQQAQYVSQVTHRKASLISAGLGHEIFPEMTSDLTANSGFRDFSPCHQRSLSDWYTQCFVTFCPMAVKALRQLEGVIEVQILVCCDRSCIQ